MKNKPRERCRLFVVTPDGAVYEAVPENSCKGCAFGEECGTQPVLHGHVQFNKHGVCAGLDCVFRRTTEFELAKGAI